MKKLILITFLIFFVLINNNVFRISKDSPGYDTVSLHLLEAEVADVIRLLSDHAGRNVIIDGNMSGSVTVDLTNVPFEDALQVILDNVGYTFVKEGDIYRLVSKAAARQMAKMEKRIFNLEYASTKDIEPIIQSLLSSSGSLIKNDRQNSLIVIDTEDNIREIESYILKIDIPVPQVAIEAKIIETSLGNLRNNVVTWDIIKDFTKEPVERERKLSFRGDMDDNEGNNLYGVISSPNLSVILDKLRKDTRVQFISCPNVTTLNNEKAEIEITTQKVIGKNTTNDIENNMQTTNTQSANVGIKLEVTPFITKNGLINLEVVPSISSAKKSELFPDEAMDVTESKANTKIMINDGETVVIGGLIKSEEISRETRIPVLSDIPLLGRKLFTQESRELEQKELTIFITARIIRFREEKSGFEKYY